MQSANLVLEEKSKSTIVCFESGGVWEKMDKMRTTMGSSTSLSVPIELLAKDRWVREQTEVVTFLVNPLVKEMFVQI